jgi:hypothetical protein
VARAFATHTIDVRGSAADLLLGRMPEGMFVLWEPHGNWSRTAVHSAAGLGSKAVSPRAGVLWAFVMHSTARLCGASQQASANYVNDSMSYNWQCELRIIATF